MRPWRQYSSVGFCVGDQLTRERIVDQQPLKWRVLAGVFELGILGVVLPAIRNLWLKSWNRLQMAGSDFYRRRQFSPKIQGRAWTLVSTQLVLILYLLIAPPLFAQQQPVIREVSPNPVTGASHRQLFTIRGEHFSRDSSVILRNQTGAKEFTIKTNEFVSTKQIAVYWAFSTLGGDWTVQVVNSNEVRSAEFPFDVFSPDMPPGISGVLPNPVPPLNRKQHLTINGTNFVEGCLVKLRVKRSGERFEIRPTKMLSVHQITIAPNFTATRDEWAVEVVNPGGQSSGEYFFKVDLAAPESNSSYSAEQKRRTGWLYGIVTIVAIGIAVLVAVVSSAKKTRRHQQELRRVEASYEERIRTTGYQERHQFYRDLHDGVSFEIAEIVRRARAIHKDLLSKASTAGAAFLDQDTRRLLIAAVSAENDLNDLFWTGEEKNDGLNALLARMRTRAREFATEAGLQVRLDFPPPGDNALVPTGFSKHLLLILNEALTNIAKHSGADTLEFRAVTAPDRLEISIKDNGGGIPQDSGSETGRGLKNMRHRAETELGGKFDISSDSEGTILQISVPLRKTMAQV